MLLVRSAGDDAPDAVASSPVIGAVEVGTDAAVGDGELLPRPTAIQTRRSTTTTATAMRATRRIQ
jgi:hypothetical protein